jgi:hypothetical protein
MAEFRALVITESHIIRVFYLRFLLYITLFINMASKAAQASDFKRQLRVWGLPDTPEVIAALTRAFFTNLNDLALRFRSSDSISDLPVSACMWNQTPKVCARSAIQRKKWYTLYSCCHILVYSVVAYIKRMYCVLYVFHRAKSMFLLLFLFLRSAVT